MDDEQPANQLAKKIETMEAKLREHGEELSQLRRLYRILYNELAEISRKNRDTP